MFLTNELTIKNTQECSISISWINDHSAAKWFRSMRRSKSS